MITKSSSAANNNGTKLAFGYFLGQLGRSALIFLASITVLLVIMYLLWSTFTSYDSMELDVQAVPAPIHIYYAGFLAQSTAIFLLVVGLAMPWHLELLLGFGITRRQQTIGLLGAGTIVAIALGVISLIVSFIAGDFRLLYIAEYLLCNLYFFLIGWIIIIGYQSRNVLAAVLSTAGGVALYSLWPFFARYGILGQLLFSSLDGEDIINRVLSLVIAAIIPVLIAAIVFLSCRISVKP